MTGITIRAVHATDVEAVRALLTEAFGGPAEAALVEALRGAGDMVLERVAVAEEEVVGYVGSSHLVSSPAERSEGKGTQAFGRPRKLEGEEPGSPSRGAARRAGDDTGDAYRVAALAPLAVAAAWRRRGIGEALVRASLEDLRTAGCDLVLVLGDPAYYGRFGFEPAAGLALRTPYDGPHQQALALSERGQTVRGCRVAYPDAFAGLE